MSAHRTRSARAVALVAVGLAATPSLLGSATAATSTPAVGSASSSISVLRVDNVTSSIRALTASLSSSTATSPDTASVSVTPVWSTVAGSVGQVTVTPADSPKHVGAGSLALPSGLASLTSPAVDVVANVANGTATAGITGSALGTISVLGTPLQLGNGALNLSNSVSKTAATSTKSVTLDQLALPTIADLLASLGLDVTKLALDQLMALFAVVESTLDPLVADGVNALNTVVSGAQAAASSTASTIAAAQSELDSKEAARDSAQATAAAAQAAFDTAIAPVNAAITGPTSTLKTALTAAGITTPFDANSWQALSGSTKTAVDAAVNTAFGSLTAAGIDAAAAAAIAAEAALATAVSAVSAAQALLDALLDLVGAVEDALGSDPLAVLGGIDAGTTATAAKTASATGHLTVGTLEVLGVTEAVSNLTSALGAVTTALSDVLNNIAGVTFTAPQVTVGHVSKATSVAKGTASALVTVTGVKITLPTLKLPTTLGLAGGASLPGIDLVNGALQSLAGTVTVAELRDSATFTQAGSSTTPGGGVTGGGGSLPTTGAPAALGLLALAIIGVAVLLRRRAHSEV